MSEFFGDYYGEGSWDELEGWTLHMASQSLRTLSDKLDQARVRYGWQSREVVASLRDIADHLYEHGEKRDAKAKLENGNYAD
mmetsp:Transcript_40653/g.98892  ORF Transcript_40653/g.98892 Transcript_40653/m.98892 type:complete len:82 (+) Transcript_40653:79-324(+)